jgi:hypothetical protein
VVAMRAVVQMDLFELNFLWSITVFTIFNLFQDLVNLLSFSVVQKTAIRKPFSPP